MLKREFTRLVVLIILVIGFSLMVGMGYSEEYLEEVSSNRIIEEIKEGKDVEYYHVKIVDDLDLREINSVVQSSIDIIDCDIQGILHLEDVIFEGPVSFSDSTFVTMALLSGAQFNDSADFSYVNFDDTVFSDSAVFRGEALFTAVNFGRDAWFSEAEFHKNCDFNFTRFSREHVSFDYAKFFENAYFEDAEFGRWTNFYGANFSGDADFLLATFPGRSFIANVWFGQDAKFASVEFGSFAEFEDSHFEGNFLLYGSTISYMKLNGTTFGENSKIHLNNTDIAGFIMPWETIKDHLVFRDEVYMGLVENYKHLGWFQGADSCYYHYRRLGQVQKEMGWSKALDYLAWISCGYGVRPDYTALWSLLIVLISGFIFYLGRGLLQYERPEERQIELGGEALVSKTRGPGRFGEPDKINEPSRIENPAGISEMPATIEGQHSAEVATELTIPEYPTLGEAMYFSSLVFIAQAPADYLALGRFKYLVILEGILGWLMLALFLVALGNIMIR